MVIFSYSGGSSAVLSVGGPGSQSPSEALPLRSPPLSLCLPTSFSRSSLCGCVSLSPPDPGTPEVSPLALQSLRNSGSEAGSGRPPTPHAWAGGGTLGRGRAASRPAAPEVIRENRTGSGPRGLGEGTGLREQGRKWGAIPPVQTLCPAPKAHGSWGLRPEVEAAET